MLACARFWVSIHDTAYVMHMYLLRMHHNEVGMYVLCAHVIITIWVYRVYVMLHAHHHQVGTCKCNMVSIFVARILECAGKYVSP